MLLSPDAKLWLSPALPMMALLRLGSSLGYAESMLLFMMRRLFTSDRMPRPFRDYGKAAGPKGRDVFITTFAKSGTNWAMQAALQIAWRGRAQFEHIHQWVPWPDAELPGIVSMDDTGPFRSTTGWRVIKTHLPAELVPYATQARYVTVLRDPKEVVVSAYYFMLGLMGLLDRISFDQWFERFADGGALAQAWAEHSASFWAWRDRPNVLVLTFGEMKADLPGAVDRIAALMDVELREGERAEVVRLAGFEFMKAHEPQFAPPRLPLRGRSPLAKMIRRGRSGGSDELLDRDRQARIDRVCRDLLRQRGSDLPYDALFHTVG